MMKDLLDKVYKAMDNKQASDIVVIDFRNQSAFVDYFVIGSARNARMAKAILDSVEEVAYSFGIEIKNKHQNLDSKWLLLDLGSIVCHIFYDGEREVYNLENLWKDLPIVKM